MTDQQRLDDAVGGGVHYQDRERWAAPWRGMWQALTAWEQAQNPGGEPTPLRAAMHRIVDEQPDARAVFALNTTLLGREGEIA